MYSFLLFIAPNFILLGVFVLWPITYSLVISFDFSTIAEIRNLETDLKLGALISRGYISGVGTGDPSVAADEMKALGIDYMGIKYQYLSKTLYEVLRSRGFGLGVWTVNDPKMMRRFADMGVDFITTDNPDILKVELAPVRQL